MTPRLTAAWICQRLMKVYGPVEPPPQLPVLDELMATILSQNTSDANSQAAFDELKRRFPSWEAVRKTKLKSLIDVIRRAGLANRKAPRMQAILRRLQSERGVLSLEFLQDWPVDPAMSYLTSFDGVGPKTAACVLLFACRKPVLPVDTHVHRVSRRLNLIADNISAEVAHQKLACLVPESRVLDFHIQLIRHGRQTCQAIRPRCEECVLLTQCRTGQARMLTADHA